MNQMAVGWAAGLAADRALLDRVSTAERVAETLRTRISEGLLPLGTQLSEETIGTVLQGSCTRAALDDGEQAARSRDWLGTGTAEAQLIAAYRERSRPQPAAPGLGDR
ncbi:hypothetical protein LWP59_13690 [Amycolatopsis acidiphila]|uniref:hypothetical protein n=1 Tax=Amycolatopsis acidiphila TaxID=715473 RepID=UPI0019978C5E|nr:hypothetical protein [Amycolatopsis acidiphila]UIJ64223.1 hypothetical protein LWP59_13690 [Amycolatopsis acidiphila]GHG85706.1 hypothetical protein GCM10017788_58560 [Amycolatopsis acidiphila]